MFLLYFIEKYLRTSIRISEAKIAGKIRTSRLSKKKGVLIKKKVYLKALKSYPFFNLNTHNANATGG